MCIISHADLPAGTLKDLYNILTAVAVVELPDGVLPKQVMVAAGLGR